MSIPMTLEQLDQQLGPNQNLKRHVNSVLRASKESQKEHGRALGNISSGPVHAMSMDILEQEEDQMLIMQY